MPTIAEVVAAFDPTQPDPMTHPLGVFLEAYQSARDKLVDERIEQRGIMDDGNATLGEKAAAQSAVLELTSAIGELDEARTVFLVRVFTGVTPPSQALVDETRDLNSKLGAAVVAANKPGVYLQIVADYLTAATQVITGNVPGAGT